MKAPVPPADLSPRSGGPVAIPYPRKPGDLAFLSCNGCCHGEHEECSESDFCQCKKASHDFAPSQTRSKSVRVSTVRQPARRKRRNPLERRGGSDQMVLFD